jgi:serine/threonine protein kinase
MDDAPQNLRDNRYAIIRTLGEGGQGATFEAVDKKLGKLVAIKRFRVRGAKSWKEVELAEREANVLSSLSHPSLPRYIEHFEEGGELFLVTEKIEGESLRELQNRGRTLSEPEVLRFLRYASDALDYLHGRAPPVVHRDIKPSNVIRRPDGSFVLIDFGSVRDRMKPEGGSTVVGTFGYMAPEQFQGRAMPVSDIYAVGATALTLLTGIEPEDLPHRGLTIDVQAALKGGQASPEMVRALTAMLEPDPDRRATRLRPLIGMGRRETTEGPANAEPRPTSKGPAKAQKAQQEDPWDFKRDRQEHRHESRELRRQLKRDVRALARESRRMQRDRGHSALPGLFLAFAILGLSIAELAVLIALKAVVPTMLVILSVFFGKGLRVAAWRVANAGTTAGEALRRAKDVVRGQQAAADSARLRVDPGIRIKAPDDPADAAAEDEGAAEDEEAREADRKRGA